MSQPQDLPLLGRDIGLVGHAALTVAVADGAQDIPVYLPDPRPALRTLPRGDGSDSEWPGASLISTAAPFFATPRARGARALPCDISATYAPDST